MPDKKLTIADFQGSEHLALPGEEELAANPNWRAADHDQGVAYIAPWEDPFAGFPEHARRCARALDDTGMPVHLRSIDPSIQFHMHFEVGGKDKVELRKQYDDLLTKRIKNYLLEIYQIVPDDAMLQRLTTHRWIDPKQLEIVNRFRIISVVFERDRVSKHAVRCFNRVGQTWVGNPHDKEMLERCGVERVRVVPIPYFPDDPYLALRGRKRLAGVPRFYHIGKWEVRKAHHEMFGAFLMAFKPGDAKLYFKTSYKSPEFADYPKGPEESVHIWVEDERVKRNGWTVELVNQNIHLIKRRIPQEQILQLHKMGDIYLSLSRGEGYDIPASNSKLAGNLLVYTPSGGPQAFASEDDTRIEPSGSQRCHPWYRWGDAEWLDWDHEAAVEGLLEAAETLRAGWPNTGHDMTAFSAHTIGARMRAHIDECLADGKRWLEERGDG